jgi:hypothetical protein
LGEYWIAVTTWKWRFGDGAHERNRTFDLLLTKEVLYRLSYVSNDVVTGQRRPDVVPRTGMFKAAAMERETGIEPAPSAWKAEVLPLNYSRVLRYGDGQLDHTPRTRRQQVVEGGGFEPPKA